MNGPKWIYRPDERSIRPRSEVSCDSPIETIGQGTAGPSWLPILVASQDSRIRARASKCAASTNQLLAKGAFWGSSMLRGVHVGFRNAYQLARLFSIIYAKPFTETYEFTELM